MTGPDPAVWPVGQPARNSSASRDRSFLEQAAPVLVAARACSIVRPCLDPFKPFHEGQPFGHPVPPMLASAGRSLLPARRLAKAGSMYAVCYEIGIDVCNFRKWIHCPGPRFWSAFGTRCDRLLCDAVNEKLIGGADQVDHLTLVGGLCLAAGRRIAADRKCAGEHLAHRRPVFRVRGHVPIVPRAGALPFYRRNSRRRRGSDRERSSDGAARQSTSGRAHFRRPEKGVAGIAGERVVRQYLYWTWF